MPINFDGTDDRIDTGFATGFGTTPFSVAFWLKTTSATNFAGFIHEYNTSNNRWKIDLNAGKVRFVVGDATTNDIATTASAYNDGAWHHVVCLRNGSNLLIYVDGVQDATATDNARDLATPLDPVVFGDSTRASSIPVELQDCRLYNYALSQAEIETLAKSRIGIGSPVQGASYTFGGVDLDGTDGWIDMGVSSPVTGGSAYTISFWGYVTGTKSNAAAYVESDGITSSTDLFVLYFGDASNFARTYHGANSLAYNDAGLANGWHHVCVVQTSTTARELFIDGISRDTDALDTSGKTPTSCFVGRWNTQYYDGKLADIRTWSSALTDAQVRDIFEAGPGGAAIGSEVGWWLLNDVADGTTINSATFTDDGSGGNNGTGSDTGNESTGTTGSVSPKQLVGYWPLSEQNVNAYEVDLDGTDDYLYIADTADLTFTDGADNDDPFSVEAWFQVGAYNTVLVVKANDYNDGEWSFGVRGSPGELFGRCIDKSAAAYIGRKTTETTTVGNTWYHGVMTYDGSNTESGIKLYFNGQETAGYTTVGAGSYVGMEDTTHEVNIGQYANGTAVKSGALAATRVWSTELTAAQVTTLYNEGKLNSFTSVDRTNLKLELNFNEVASVTNQVLPEGDYTADDNYIDCGNVCDVDHTFSVSYWMKTTQSGTMVGRSGTMKHWETTIASNAIRFDAGTSLTGATVVNDGRWHHVVVTSDASNSINIYVDGNLDAGPTTVAVGTETENFAIMARNDGTFEFDGFIADVQIWESTELTSGNVSTIHTNGRYGTAVASPTHRWYLTVPGQDYGVRFDGQNSAAIFGGDYYDDSANTVRTWTWWFRSEGPASTYMICKRGSDAGNPGYYFWINSANKLAVSLDAGTNDLGISSVNDVTDSGWHHAGVIHNDDRIEMYIDGVFVTGKGPADDTNNVIPASHANNGPLTFGARKLGFASATNIFSGDLYDVRTWDYALPPSTMSGLYQSGRTLSQASPTGEIHRWYLDDAVESDGNNVVFQDSVGSLVLTGSHGGSNSIIGYKLDGIGEVWPNSVAGSGASVAIGKDTSKAGLTFSNPNSFDDQEFRDSSGNDNHATAVDETLNSSQLRSCGIGEVVFRDFSGNENDAAGSDANDSREQVTQNTLLSYPSYE